VPGLPDGSLTQARIQGPESPAASRPFRLENECVCGPGNRHHRFGPRNTGMSHVVQGKSGPLHPTDLSNNPGHHSKLRGYARNSCSYVGRQWLHGARDNGPGGDRISNPLSFSTQLWGAGGVPDADFQSWLISARVAFGFSRAVFPTATRKDACATTTGKSRPPRRPSRWVRLNQSRKRPTPPKHAGLRSGRAWRRDRCRRP